MRTSTIVWIVIIIIVILGLGWYFLGSSMSPSPAASTTTTNINTTTAPPTTSGSTSSTASNTAASASLMTASDATLGTILVAQNGMTLYTYSPDTANKSTCTGQCAAVWPPYIVSGAPTAAAGLSGTLATTVRSDGSTQLTYNGHPLYFYSKDTAAGQTNGQGIGNVWYVVNP